MTEKEKFLQTQKLEEVLHFFILRVIKNGRRCEASPVCVSLSKENMNYKF